MNTPKWGAFFAQGCIFLNTSVIDSSLAFILTFIRFGYAHTSFTFINFCKIKILWNFTLIQVEFDLNYLKLFMIFTNDSFVIINKQK